MSIITFLDADTLGQGLDFSPLKELGTLELYQSTKPEQVLERLEKSAVAVVNKIRFDSDLLGRLPNLKLIALTATGFDNVDLVAAREKKIAVCNVAGYSTSSVAQHTIALAMALVEPLDYWNQFVRSGEYSGSGAFTHWGRNFDELEGKVWGIYGLGAIGKRVAHIAKALGCRLVYYSTSGANRSEEYQRLEWDEFLSICDVLSIHAPLNEKTRGAFHIKTFEKMKPSALLLNLGRGPIVVEADLALALEKKLLAGAALDVFSKEPLSLDSPLLKLSSHPKLYLTPHVAWGSRESRQRCMNEVAANIRSFFLGEKRMRVD